MSLAIRRTGSADYGHHIKALICGRGGAGKTKISSTFPSPFYASAESGLMSIADQNLPFTVIKSSGDLHELLQYMQLDPDKRTEALGVQVDTVIIDTIDEIQDILINERMISERTDTMKIQDWGWLSEQMKAIIVGFRNLEMNVVFTCHLKQVTDSDTGQVWYLPGLKGSIDEKIPAHVDLSLLLRYETETKIVDGHTEKVRVRQLLCQPVKQYEFLKDRSGKLPAVAEVNFKDDYQRMHDAIYSNLDFKDTKEVIVDALPKPPSLKDKPQMPPSAKEILAEKKRKKEEVPPPTRKPVAQAAGGIPEEPIYKVKAEAGGTVLSRNELPENVLAKPKGFDTNIYCVITGDEVESDIQADLSRIRHRKILSKGAMDALKR